jgi:hypothetical protein
MAVATLIIATGAPPEGCTAIEPTKAQRHAAFGHAVALDRFAMRILAGESSCDQLPWGQVVCLAVDPQLVHITVDGRHFWFKVPAGRSAVIEVEGPVPKCQLA